MALCGMSNQAHTETTTARVVTERTMTDHWNFTFQFWDLFRISFAIGLGWNAALAFRLFVAVLIQKVFVEKS
jgi:hypothetical protein